LIHFRTFTGAVSLKHLVPESLASRVDHFRAFKRPKLLATSGTPPVEYPPGEDDIS
jgi:hypothetical protein